MPSVIGYAHLQDELNSLRSAEYTTAKNITQIIDACIKDETTEELADRIVGMVQLSCARTDLPTVMRATASAIQSNRNLDTKQKSELSKNVYSKLESYLEPLRSLIRS